MRPFRLLFLAALLLTSSGCGAFWHGSAGPIVSNAFTNLKTCGGGLVVGADMSATGVRFMRTDVFSAYIWGTGDSKWHNVITKSSMTGQNHGFGLFPAANGQWQGINSAPLDIAGAPSDSTVAYMFYNGLIFVSSNISTTSPDSITWKDTGFTQVSGNSNGNWRQAGRRIAVDPNNSSHVVVGTMESGVWETTNGLAATPTWTQISTGVLPLAQVFDPGGSNNPAYSIVFDPASGTNGSGLTNGLYIFTPSLSNPGVYRTTNGSTASLALTSGGPTTAMTMMKAAPTGGVIWAVDAPSASGGGGQDGSVWKILASSGVWTHVLTANSYHSIAISPQIPTHIVALANNGGNLNVSTNGGSTWSGIINSNALANGDTPWLTQIATQLSPNDVNFDPLVSDALVFDGGQGVWTTSLPSTGFTWTALANGIEEFIGENITVTSSNHITVGGQDLGAFSYDATSNTSCLSNPYALVKAGGVNNGLHRAELASPPGVSNFLVAKNASNFGTNTDYSGTSNDGFVNNSVPFNTFNATVNSSALSDNGSGSHLVRVSMATTGLTTWANGSGTILCAISYSNAITVGVINGHCYPVTVVNGTTLDLQGSNFQSVLTAVNVNYVFWAPTPPMSNYNGALNVTATASNAGKIQVSIIHDIGLANGWVTCLTGVLGTTEANGCWIAEQSSGRNFTLGPTSTFTNAYTGGGAVTTYQEPGGSVAAASSTNFVFIPANSAMPTCTADGGQTWSSVTNAAIPRAWTTVAVQANAGATTVTLTNSGNFFNGYSAISIPMDDGRLFTSNIAGNNTGTNVVTFSDPVPTGRHLSVGANVSNGTGWGSAAFLNYKAVDVDQVTANTFYAFNSDVGIVKWTGCGATTLINSGNVASGSGFAVFAQFNAKLKTVPGEAGHLFFAAGPEGNGTSNHAASTQLWRACNGNTTSANGLTMQAVSGIFEPISVGFGKAAPGQSYPAIYVVGWYDAGGVQANATFGVWRSIDDANHGNSGTGVTCTGGNTWTKLQDFPMGWNVEVNDVQGDPGVYGQVYLAGPSGQFIGTFN